MKYLDDRYMILGLAGRAGAGKDTAADILCQHLQFYRLAFADALREEVVEAFGIDPDLFQVSTKERKTAALAIGRCNDGDFITLMQRLGVSITEPRSPREIMRWWGTEYRRVQDPLYWLEKAALRIEDAHRRGFRRIVITDVRFKNEADFVRHYNGQVWVIKRALADTVAANHASEKELDSIWPDAVIENNGSMTRFATAIMQAYQGKQESVAS